MRSRAYRVPLRIGAGVGMEPSLGCMGFKSILDSYHLRLEYNMVEGAQGSNMMIFGAPLFELGLISRFRSGLDSEVPSLEHKLYLRICLTT